MARDLGYSRTTLGLIGGSFSLVYALGLLLNGQLAVKLGVRKLVPAGLILSAVVNTLFGYFEIPLLMIMLWAVNGYAQSTGWPSVIKVIRDCFHEGLGTVGGLFGSCFLVGSMIALSISGYIAANFGWRLVFQIPPMIGCSSAIIFYLGIKEELKHEQRILSEPANVESPFALRKILFSKRFIAFATIYTLLQFVRSGLTLWAPSFIHETYSASLDLASYSASAISFGGIAGSIVSGWLSDRMRSRVPVMAVMMLSLTLLLPITYNSFPYGLSVGVFLFFLSGLTLYGPHVILVTTIPMDYGERYGAAKIAGFIDSVGYVGIMFADSFTGWIIDTISWSGAITFWTTSALLATILALLLWRLLQ